VHRPRADAGGVGEESTHVISAALVAGVDDDVVAAGDEIPGCGEAEAVG